MIVSRKIISATLSLSRIPNKIHSHPAKAGGRDHFHFAGLRVSEMNVHSKTLLERFRIDSRGPGLWTIGEGTVSGERERKENREERQGKPELHNDHGPCSKSQSASREKTPSIATVAAYPGAGKRSCKRQREVSFGSRRLSKSAAGAPGATETSNSSSEHDKPSPRALM